MPIRTPRLYIVHSSRMDLLLAPARVAQITKPGVYSGAIGRMAMGEFHEITVLATSSREAVYMMAQHMVAQSGYKGHRYDESVERFEERAIAVVAPKGGRYLMASAPGEVAR